MTKAKPVKKAKKPVQKVKKTRKVKPETRERKVRTPGKTASGPAQSVGKKSPARQNKKLPLQKENYFNAIFDSVAAGVIVIDAASRRIKGCNPAAAGLIGLAEEQIKGKLCHQFICPTEQGKCPIMDLGQKVDHSERILLTGAGSRIPILKTVARVTHQGRDLLIDSFLDIREQKKAETTLKESKEALIREKRFAESLIETAQVIVLVLDPQGRIVRFNPYMQELFGYRLEEVRGLDWFAAFLPVDRQNEIRDLFHGAIGDIQTWGNVNAVKTKDGRTRDIEWYDKTLKDDQGRVTGLLCIGQDVTERKRTEEALRESEKNLRRLLESVNEGIWYIDRDSRTSYANPRMAEMLGYTVEEMQGKHLFDFMDAEGRQIAQANLERRQQGIKEQHDFEFMRKDGRRVYASLETAPITDESGNYQGAIAGVQDITKRKLLEEERIRMEAQLQKAQRLEAIGTLAGGIAHDFNNILYAILGNAEMLQSDLPEKSHSRFSVEQIMKAGYRARDLVQQILTFSRQTEGEVMAVDVAVLTAEILKLLRASLPAQIKICRQITAKRKSVLADPIQIHQILMNLCTNAHYAMLEKGGILDVSLSDEEINENRNARYADLKPGTYVKLMVSDTGCGMSPEIMSRIFEPYFTTRDKRGGTGLGLAVVHGIVKKLGGFIGVQSEWGKGSTFEVLLPAIDRQCLPDPVSAEPVAGGTESILFVDDEEAIADLAQRSLQRLGYRVVAKTGSVEALEHFKTQPNDWDLVITDMAMPNLTGEDLTIELRRLRPDLPVILCTGFSECMNKEKAMALGVKAFIMKPFVMKELAKIIRKVLDEKGRGQSAFAGPPADKGARVKK